MPLKLVCPNCRADVRLSEPLPLPGAAVQCERCATPIAVSYPPGVIDQLRARGKRFAETDPRSTPRGATPAGASRQRPPSPGRGATPAGPGAWSPADSLRGGPQPAWEPRGAQGPAGWPAHHDEAGSDAGMDDDELPQPPARGQNGYGAAEWGHHADREGGARRPRETPAPRPLNGTPMNGSARQPSQGGSRPAARANDVRGRSAPPRGPSTPRGDGRGPAPAPPPGPSVGDTARQRVRMLTGALGCLGTTVVGGGLLLLVFGLIGMYAGYSYFSADLPTIEALRAYSPPTVTVVTDRNGDVLGEIFEEKRYVVPIEEIPDHVKNAFLAAEDANFYSHDGIDYMGIVRAMLRNAASGEFSQGASTITQQVARNFLLTKDKTIVRKIKEVILSWRIEDAYEKDHILFLYLNQIFLGAQSYGVEAASRTYFGKHVREISVAEAAILAGLPQRPSDYTPYKGWDKARGRQEYVIRQMVAKSYLTEADGQAALAEEVVISPRENKFRSKAPYFTEHVRRYLVDKYGEERVLYEGLNVKTTCDMKLQEVAQAAVRRGVYDTDQRMGYRRKGVENVGQENIGKKRSEIEQRMRQSWAETKDPAGRVPVPDRSQLEVGELYDGVIVEVSPKWAKIGIGDHDALLPISLADWVYEPDPNRSWRGRTASDLTAKVDGDDDGRRDSPILMAGDLVKVRVEALSSSDDKVAKHFRSAPSGEWVAISLFQTPEVESALLSMDLDTGAVRVMVGGADFDRSEFNRAVQARRQVGSTFKPIVYAAAIASKRVTTATMVADAPLAMATDNDFVWKPSNYSNDYEGNMTMRQALMKSKNTCTVRILESADPGMNDDVVYKFARKLGIGGPPTHTLPTDYVASPTNDVLCPWLREESDFTICMDRYPAKDPNLSDSQHRAKLTKDAKYYCRACDMSMGLGSASLTMEEMLRAYSAFPTGGKLVEPYYVEEVTDRQGNVLEQHVPQEPVQVMDPAVASITTWLMQAVVQGGTASDAGRELRLSGLAGKTGTTNDEKDAWFVGFTNDVITAVWFGYDQPQTLGVSSTGGRTALPVWIEYMKVAAPKSKDRSFPIRGNVLWAEIEEATGRRVTTGGVSYPFLEGTVPEGTGLEAGQVGVQDI